MLSVNLQLNKYYLHVPQQCGNDDDLKLWELVFLFN